MAVKIKYKGFNKLEIENQKSRIEICRMQEYMYQRRCLLYDHNNKLLLPYHYVSEFNEIGIDWNKFNMIKEESVEGKYAKQLINNQKKYIINICKMCGAKYLDTENNSHSYYHTCCHALKKNKKTIPKAHNHLSFKRKYNKMWSFVQTLQTGHNE